MGTEHAQPSRKWSAPGGDNLRCTDWVESEGAGQLCAGGRPFAPGEAGAEKTQLRNGVAQGLKKVLGRHSRQVLRNLQRQYDSFLCPPGEPLPPITSDLSSRSTPTCAKVGRWGQQSRTECREVSGLVPNPLSGENEVEQAGA